MAPTLLAILVCLLLAYLLSEAFRVFGMPRLVGQVFAGLLLSIGVVKYYLFTPQSLEILSFLANLGIILLFYYVGLETNFKAFEQNLKKSIVISLFNTSLPLILGFVMMRFVFHFSTLTSMIVGVTLAVSAQSVSVNILEELSMLKSKIGSMIISAGAVDDILELLLVSAILSSFDFFVNNLSFQRMLLNILIFLVFVIFAKLWFVPKTLKFFDKEGSSTSRFMTSLIIVFIFAYFSDVLGIGSLIGAMITGMIVRHTIFRHVELPNWEEHDIARSIHIISFGFLIPLFFVWVGVNIDVSFIFQNIVMTLLFVVIAIVCTVTGTVAAVLLTKGTLKQGIILGWGLTPKGDVELVIAALALKSGIINQQIFTSLVMMSLITTIISPIIFKRLVVKHKDAGNALPEKKAAA